MLSDWIRLSGKWGVNVQLLTRLVLASLNDITAMSVSNRPYSRSKSCCLVILTLLSIIYNSMSTSYSWCRHILCMSWYISQIWHCQVIWARVWSSMTRTWVWRIWQTSRGAGSCTGLTSSSVETSQSTDVCLGVWVRSKSAVSRNIQVL